MFVRTACAPHRFSRMPIRTACGCLFAPRAPPRSVGCRPRAMRDGLQRASAGTPRHGHTSTRVGSSWRRVDVHYRRNPGGAASAPLRTSPQLARLVIRAASELPECPHDWPTRPRCRTFHAALPACSTRPTHPTRAAGPTSTSSWRACWRGATTTGGSCSSTCSESESRRSCWDPATCGCTAWCASTRGTSGTASSSAARSNSTG